VKSQSTIHNRTCSVNACAPVHHSYVKSFKLASSQIFFVLLDCNHYIPEPISQMKLVLSITKSKRPAAYAKTHKIVVNRQIFLLLTSNSVELNRHKLTTHTPKTNVEIPKNSCASQLTKCKGGLRTVGK
jgi:hypothetical protein